MRLLVCVCTYLHTSIFGTLLLSLAHASIFGTLLFCFFKPLTNKACISVFFDSSARLRLATSCSSLDVYIGLARTIHIYGVHTVFSAGKSSHIRSYTVCKYGSGQPYVYNMYRAMHVHKQRFLGINDFGGSTNYCIHQVRPTALIRNNVCVLVCVCVCA